MRIRTLYVSLANMMISLSGTLNYTLGLICPFTHSRRFSSNIHGVLCHLLFWLFLAPQSDCETLDWQLAKWLKIYLCFHLYLVLTWLAEKHSFFTEESASKLSASRLPTVHGSIARYPVCWSGLEGCSAVKSTFALSAYGAIGASFRVYAACCTTVGASAVR